MTEDQREIGRKERVIEYAERIGIVHPACRRPGIARSTFHVWRDWYRESIDEVANLLPLRDEYAMWLKVTASLKPYDLEARFRLHVQERHDLWAGKRIRLALSEPMMVVFED